MMMTTIKKGSLKEAQMTKFIDTDAGRQLLKEHFYGYYSRKKWEIVDPNFLEWQDSWADSPILEDIQKLFIDWKKRRDKYVVEWGEYTWEFQRDVKDYLAENQEKGDCGTYINCEDYLECNKFYEDDTPNTLLQSIEYDDLHGFLGYTDKYLDELKSLVSENQ